MNRQETELLDNLTLEDIKIILTPSNNEDFIYEGTCDCFT